MWVPDSQQCHWSSDTVDGSMEAYVDGSQKSEMGWHMAGGDKLWGLILDSKFHIGMPGGHVMIRCLFSLLSLFTCCLFSSLGSMLSLNALMLS